MSHTHHWDHSQWWWHRTDWWPRSHNDGEITDLWLNSVGGSLGGVEQIIYSWELWQVPAIPTHGSRRAFTPSEKQKKRKKRKEVFPNLKHELVLCSWGRHLKASGKKCGQLPPGPLSMKSVYCDLDSRADTVAPHPCSYLNHWFSLNHKLNTAQKMELKMQPSILNIR